ncbi:MAG: hypothetical protein M3Z10_13990 [Gemmatimonadota bacterium]|nr:hypothetical protein [Gemmatimonadota bacterium]
MRTSTHGSAAQDWNEPSLSETLAQAEAPPPSTLWWLARTFEFAQRERIRRGERIRAIAQARDHRWNVPGDVGGAEALLNAIDRGETLGPIPFLGMLYQRAWVEERQLSHLLEETITMHSAWPWLVQIRGVGPRLAARLLSRLRIERARSPSAFWAYCGLGTVAGAEYRCDRCAAHFVVSARNPAPARHVGKDRVACEGRLVPAAPSGHLRVAQPRPRRLEARRYDATAKTICFLIGTSFSRQGGPYKTYYQEAYARYASRHPTWPAKHVVFAAMRVTVKLFLKHLWIVWRGAEGMSSDHPDSVKPAFGDTGPGPWDMVSPPSQEKLRAAERLAKKSGVSTVRRGRPPKQAAPG